MELNLQNMKTINYWDDIKKEAKDQKEKDLEKMYNDLKQKK